MKQYIAKTFTGNTHTFSAENADVADAYCLMHSLELVGICAPKKLSGPAKGDALLSKKQKATLCQLAANVFRDLDSLGLIDASGDTTSKRLASWRREQCHKAVGIASLTRCRNSQYRRLHDWFSSMTGSDYANPHMKCTGPQTNQAGDTMEAREQAIKLIETEVATHLANGGPIGMGYVYGIAKNRFKNTKLITLTANQLEQLLYTTRNRIAAKEGRGQNSNRNKKQRGDGE